MEVLERLKTKIEHLLTSYSAIKEENEKLKEQVNNSSLLHDEIRALKEELAKKDAEIEAIIQKVEALLA
ncbi:MAG TPA: cell division protein ZapB [Epsilonproteobacteria bacterium]|nr:cell division protein ZapB [Campylobacterota bacterium]